LKIDATLGDFLFSWKTDRRRCST